MSKDAKTGAEVLRYPLPRKRPPSNRPADFLASLDRYVSKVWEQEEWCKLQDAVTHKSSIEGKVEYDRGLAADMIRGLARKDGDLIVAGAKISRIARGTETLLRRDGQGRKQRLLKMNSAQAAE